MGLNDYIDRLTDAKYLQNTWSSGYKENKIKVQRYGT